MKNISNEIISAEDEVDRALNNISISNVVYEKIEDSIYGAIGLSVFDSVWDSVSGYFREII